MDNQVAHDLAVAKLYGSDLSEEEMYKAYLQTKDKFIEVINKKPINTPRVIAVKRTF